MNISEKTREENARLLRQLSLYLNLMPAEIDKSMVDEIAGGESFTKADREYAFAALLAAYCGLDIQYDAGDKALFRNTFLKMVHLEDKNEFKNDPFYKNIKIENVKNGEWEICRKSFKAYEAFVADQSKLLPDGRLMPRIGFFDEEFFFPAVLQNGREWMTITPHEIRTTMPAVKRARGKVATYGLGLGYFAYMASEKPEVDSVTVIELDERVIKLFKEYILPQFPCKDKIEIINTDAFEFAKNKAPKAGFDFVFADTWHDPSDGIEMYKKFKELEALCPDTEFCYWIEYTLKYYMEQY